MARRGVGAGGWGARSQPGDLANHRLLAFTGEDKGSIWPQLNPRIARRLAKKAAKKAARKRGS